MVPLYNDDCKNIQKYFQLRFVACLKARLRQVHLEKFEKSKDIFTKIYGSEFLELILANFQFNSHIIKWVYSN